MEAYVVLGVILIANLLTCLVNCVLVAVMVTSRRKGHVQWTGTQKYSARP